MGPLAYRWPTPRHGLVGEHARAEAFGAFIRVEEEEHDLLTSPGTECETLAFGEVWGVIDGQDGDFCHKYPFLKKRQKMGMRGNKGGNAKRPDTE